MNFDNAAEDESFRAVDEELDFDDAAIVLAMGGFDSSSDDEMDLKSNREGRARNKDRDFLQAHQQQVKCHFNGRESLCDEKDFERRFRCPRSVFSRVHDALIGRDPFTHKKDATGKLISAAPHFLHVL